MCETRLVKRWYRWKVNMIKYQEDVCVWMQCRYIPLSLIFMCRRSLQVSLAEQQVGLQALRNLYSASKYFWKQLICNRTDIRVPRVCHNLYKPTFYTLKMEARVSSEIRSYFLPHYTDSILYSYLCGKIQPSKYIDYSCILKIFRAFSLVNITKT